MWERQEELHSTAPCARHVSGSPYELSKGNACKTFWVNNNLHQTTTSPIPSRLSQLTKSYWHTSARAGNRVWATTANNNINNHNNLTKCQREGWAALKGGRGHPVYHAQANYRFHHKSSLGLFPDKEVFVIRTKHLWDDVVSGSTIGRDGTLSVERQAKHAQQPQLSSQEPIGVGRSFCWRALRSLYPEIQIYQNLILRAANLNATAKCESLTALYEKCGMGPS